MLALEFFMLREMLSPFGWHLFVTLTLLAEARHDGCSVFLQVLDSEQDQDLVEQEANPQDIEDLFDELENLSESDPEVDTISVLSTPKPKLRWVGEAMVLETDHPFESLG